MEQRHEYPTVPEEALKGVARTRFDSPEPTPEQLARRERSLEVLKQLSVPYLESLPVVEDESSIKPRSAVEIAQRCLAVAICAIKGETNDHELGQELLADYGARPLLSPNERAFMADPAPSRQQLIDYAWSYEVLHVLLWSLGFLPELQPPNKICDVSFEVGIIRDHGDAQRLASESTPRPLAEILDAADLYYHFHWSAIDVRIRGESSTALDEGIVRERHRALNWLVRYLGQDWDDITTDT